MLVSIFSLGILLSVAQSAPAQNSPNVASASIDVALGGRITACSTDDGRGGTQTVYTEYDAGGNIKLQMMMVEQDNSSSYTLTTLHKDRSGRLVQEPLATYSASGSLDSQMLAGH